MISENEFRNLTSELYKTIIFFKKPAGANKKYCFISRAK